ncbi:DUF4245 domain-containing protein [Agromyces sp. Leaf222]|uniref:DUF4245 domain-containing protein n=1 Tax=Agromyces sp. Leaf222 TaxID=1735688 RepID=UPI0006F69787|nr:DUF4245 domain-containing protein [Agromyces sp. Leaf222]KQM83019.1 hypothetical protein ASE68_06950 [Agromyces sp. Leaf222]
MAEPAQGRVVAELGRPETPEETAARKAKNSREYRERKTTRNLVYALLASLAVVLVIVLAVPRSDEPMHADVDVAAIAEQAQAGSEEPLAVPDLPEGWSANAAELRRSQTDGITAWYTGYLTPSGEFIGLSQGLDANATWSADLLARTLATGTVQIDGVDWTVYDNRDSSDDLGNARYGLTTEAGSTVFVLVGTATDAEFATLASAIADTVQAQQ